MKTKPFSLLERWKRVRFARSIREDSGVVLLLSVRCSAGLEQRARPVAGGPEVVSMFQPTPQPAATRFITPSAHSLHAQRATS